MATDFGFRAYDVERCADPFVFISYKSEDYERVAVYARHLVKNGINVWYDEGLHSGVDWESYLMSVIEKPHCKAVLLFLSAKVAQSTVIPLETTQARACKKPTVAVHLEPGLDIEVLLSKAIKIYVEQRQSVRAHIGTQESICAEVLAAARNAMAGTPAAVSHSSVETLWKNAQMFLMNARRSGSSEDTDRARKYLEQMTEQEPSDHRGWLGLALCACLHRPESSEGALRQLREGAKYYSYVVAAGADNIASQEYTDAKSRLWEDVLKVYRQDAARYTGADEVKRLREQAAQLGSFFGHTQPHLRGDYDRLLAEMDARVRAAEAEQLRLEKEAEMQAIAAQCEWENDSGGGVCLKKYIGKSSRVIIPGTVGGRKVTSIGDEAFRDCAGLTSVTIPDSVTHIGYGAFRDCAGLTSVTIPDSVTSIGSSAFYDCTGLTSVTIPGSVTHIGNCAFDGCAGLTSVTIPDSVTHIGNGAFCDCTSLTSITIPDSVVDIGDMAFYGCTGLTSVTIPGSVTHIGIWAFYGCTGLTSITIPDSVTDIGWSAFKKCTGLTSVTIPGKVKELGEEVFQDCPNLTVYGTGGFFSEVRKAALQSRVKYKKIK